MDTGEGGVGMHGRARFPDHCSRHAHTHAHSAGAAEGICKWGGVRYYVGRGI